MPAIIKNSHFYNNGSLNRDVGTSGMAGIPGTPGVSGFVSITEGLPVSYEEIPGTTRLESRFVDLYDDYSFTPYDAELKNLAGVIDKVDKASSKSSSSNPAVNKVNVGKVKNDVVSIKTPISKKPTTYRESNIKNKTVEALKDAIQNAFPLRVFNSIYEKIRK